jgi:hypothetical protein
MESLNLLADNDLDSLINFETNFVSVDSSTAVTFADKDARITFEGVDCSKCNANNIVYADPLGAESLMGGTGPPPGLYETIEALQAEARSCSLSGRCSNFSCSSGDCSFDVTGFTGYASSGNANLTINDSAEVSPANTNTAVTYYTYYVNATNGSLITGANCTVTDDSGTNPMIPGVSYYSYTRGAGYLFAGTYNWNVTCSASEYTTLFANDTIDIIESGYSAVPEFSDYALVLIVLTAIGGFFVVKRKRGI